MCSMKGSSNSNGTELVTHSWLREPESRRHLVQLTRHQPIQIRLVGYVTRRLRHAADRPRVHSQPVRQPHIGMGDLPVGACGRGAQWYAGSVWYNHRDIGSKLV